MSIIIGVASKNGIPEATAPAIWSPCLDQFCWSRLSEESCFCFWGVVCFLVFLSLKICFDSLFSEEETCTLYFGQLCPREPDMCYVQLQIFMKFVSIKFSGTSWKCYYSLKVNWIGQWFNHAPKMWQIVQRLIFYLRILK